MRKTCAREINYFITVFNTNISLLIAGTPLKGGKCCGATGYNPSTHSCCFDSISPIHGMVEPACCMLQAYDRSLSNITCCGGKLSRKTEDETECSASDGVIHRPDEIVCNGVRHPAGKQQCCGADLYDPTTQMCCNGSRWDIYLPFHAYWNDQTKCLVWCIC